MRALYRYTLPQRQLNIVKVISSTYAKYIGGIPWIIPKLKDLTVPEEHQLYTMVKSKNFDNAFLLFTSLLQDKFKLSPILFKLGVDLSVHVGNPISLNELTAYIEEHSIVPESSTMSFLLIDCAEKQNTDYLLEMLDTIFTKQLPIRKQALTSSIEFLLKQTDKFQMVADLVDKCIEKNYQFQDVLLNALCLRVTDNLNNPILLETLKKVLLSCHNNEQAIGDEITLNQLISTLSKLNKENLVPVTLKNGICIKCGNKLRELALTNGEYELLLSEIKRIMVNQYLTFQRTEKLKVELTAYKKMLAYLPSKFPKGKVLVVDGMNVSHLRKVGFALDLLHHRVELVKRQLTVSSAFVVLRFVVRKNNELFWGSLNRDNLVFITGHDSRDDLYCVYATMKMKERGLLLTNDRLRELKNDIPLSVHPILNKWHYLHVLNFGKEPFRVAHDKDLIARAVEYTRDGSIHIPMKENGMWYCTKL